MQKLQAFNEQLSQKRNAYNKQAKEKDKKTLNKPFYVIALLAVEFLFLISSVLSYEVKSSFLLHSNCRFGRPASCFGCRMPAWPWPCVMLMLHASFYHNKTNNPRKSQRILQKSHWFSDSKDSKDNVRVSNGVQKIKGHNLTHWKGFWSNEKFQKFIWKPSYTILLFSFQKERNWKKEMNLWWIKECMMEKGIYDDKVQC